MRKWISLMLMVLLCVTSCGAPVAEDGVAEATIVDSAGREVAIPDEVDSIACLYAYAGHATVLLGQEEKIVAVVNGLKRDVLMQRKVPGIEDMPTPYTSRAINIETLLALAPDISFVRLYNLQSQGEREKLEGSGLTFVGVDYVTMAEQMETIRFMGQALGAEDRAEAYLTYYEETLQRIEDRVSEIPEEERLRVYHSVNEVVRTDVAGSMTDELLGMAGAWNVVTDEGSAIKREGEKAYTSVEQIYQWDPDVVLVNEPDAYRYFMEQDAFSGLRAVREGQVIQLPVGISRWGHPGSIETPMAGLFIAKALYPDQFQDVDMVAETRAFYKTFFQMDLSDEEISMILQGQGMREPRE